MSSISIGKAHNPIGAAIFAQGTFAQATFALGIIALGIFVQVRQLPKSDFCPSTFLSKCDFCPSTFLPKCNNVPSILRLG